MILENISVCSYWVISFPKVHVSYKGVAKEGTQEARPLIECCLALLRTINEQVSDF